MPVFSFLVYIVVSTFTPGPNNFMAMLFAHRYGFRRTIRFCLGVGAGFFVVALLCSYCNLLLKNLIPGIRWWMTILGAAYMLYLAVKIMFHHKKAVSSREDKNNRFLTAALLQFINPKGILYAITAVSTFILPYHSSHLALIGFSLFLALLSVISTFCWSMFGSIFQQWLSAYQTPFNVAMGLLLAYSAVSILVE
ncbi:threonine/homoserine/homoserine lactone efflux protein [Paenibacillus favisporus]|uniref:Threonine/homoserine/homoserine lactone efflux protein n=1 Tax=Paenibacillus favisporus TaxID=221028 RepID=A0ABV2F5G7_9BACL